MRKLVALVLLVSSVAIAGEVLIGSLTVTDAGSTTNRTNGNINSNVGNFVIQPLTLVSIQCDQETLVITDAAGCDAGTCIDLGAKQFLTTSVNTSKTLSARAWNWDAGSQAISALPVVTYTGGWMAIAAPAGQAVSYCRVFVRKGDE